jgi:hypothetical protein
LDGGATISSAYVTAPGDDASAVLPADTASYSTYDTACPVVGAVVGLSLSRNNLSGVVDDALHDAALARLAPTLFYLFARVNDLRGPIAHLLRGMYALRRVGVSNNRLTGVCVLFLRETTHHHHHNNKQPPKK